MIENKRNIALFMPFCLVYQSEKICFKKLIQIIF